MQGIGKNKDRECEVIDTNMEKYIAFSLSNCKDKWKISLRGIDSFQYIPASPEKLMENLTPDKFNILRERFPNNTSLLLLRKGVYRYEYFTSFTKFDEIKLPLPYLHFTVI